MTWQHYLKDTLDELRPRYVELSEDVAVRTEELGMVQADEVNARVQGFKHSEAGSVSGAEWDAKIKAEGITTELVKLRAALDAVKEERDLVRWILDATAR